jgi:hypothetical protein
MQLIVLASALLSCWLHLEYVCTVHSTSITDGDSDSSETIMNPVYHNVTDCLKNSSLLLFSVKVWNNLCEV